MRIVGLMTVAVALCVPGVACAQSWFEYFSREDLFSINLPVEPGIEEFTYISEYGSKLPARRYTSASDGSRYVTTVVNMMTTNIDPRRHGNELRGAIGFAATALRQTGEVTFDAYAEINVIPGHQLQITLPDGRRNFAEIHYHAKRLYITEAIVPAEVPTPAVFQASFAVTDEEGNALRYEDNNYSFPDGRLVIRRGNDG